MTFALTPAVPYTNGTGVVEDSDLNYWRAAIAQAMDGAGGTGLGAPYTPLQVIAVRGSGMDVDPLTFAVRSGGSGTWLTGSTAEWKGGSTFKIDPNCTVTIQTGVTYAHTSGPTWTVGLDDGGTTTGFLEVNPFSQIALGSSTNSGTYLTGTASLVVEGTSASHYAWVDFQGWSMAHFAANAQLRAESGSTATFLGTLTTDQPASNADTGANNIKVTDVAKAWGEIQVNASTTPTINDARNVNSVSAAGGGGTGSVTVNFKHAMANAHYSVTFSTQSFTNTSGLQFPVAYVVSKSTGGFVVEFREGSQNTGTWDAGELIDPTAVGVNFPFSFTVHARQ